MTGVQTCALPIFEDLPLFASAAPRQPSAMADSALGRVLEALAALHPDEMSPREAMDALYALKARLAETRKA